METKELLLLINIMVYALLNGMIGIIDDVAKMRKKQNKGLSAMQKLILQSSFSVLFLISLHFSVGIDTVLRLPFINIEIDLGLFYYVLAFFTLCGIVNSVNLTDGIDGLASSIVFTVGLFLAAVNIVYLERYTLTFVSAIVLGSTAGFLIYNFYPARVFMGDTGSLYLGGLIAASPFLIDNLSLVFLYGIVFIIEAVSDILQVIFFKATKGKRLFKMAPLHHHFEKCGWSEQRIVITFSVFNLLFCLIAFVGYGI